MTMGFTSYFFEYEDEHDDEEDLNISPIVPSSGRSFFPKFGFLQRSSYGKRWERLAAAII